jgi:hypothetical protein
MLMWRFDGMQAGWLVGNEGEMGKLKMATSIRNKAYGGARLPKFGKSL